MLSVASRFVVTLPLQRLRTAERLTRAMVGRRLPVELSLAVVGAAAMRRLNRERRGESAVTDVLSFGPAPALAHVPALATGEVVVCLPVAQSQAKRLGHTWRDELVVLLVHGLLHIAGYDHHRSADTVRMRRLEARILARLGMAGSGLVERAEVRPPPHPIRGGPPSPSRERGWG